MTTHRAMSWRKSSKSPNDSAQCIEAAHAGSCAIAIRDSKLDTSGDFPHLTIPTANWQGLLVDVYAGLLDT